MSIRNWIKAFLLSPSPEEQIEFCGNSVRLSSKRPGQDYEEEMERAREKREEISHLSHTLWAGRVWQDGYEHIE